jgi:hypothetical protein
LRNNRKVLENLPREITFRCLKTIRFGAQSETILGGVPSKREIGIDGTLDFEKFLPLMERDTIQFGSQRPPHQILFLVVQPRQKCGNSLRRSLAPPQGNSGSFATPGEIAVEDGIISNFDWDGKIDRILQQRLPELGCQSAVFV